jgi:hypothetical protein
LDIDVVESSGSIVICYTVELSSYNLPQQAIIGTAKCDLFLFHAKRRFL